MAIHTENPQENLPAGKNLLVYLVSSIVARDFYKVPVAAAFIIASAYAMLITRSVDKTDDKISIFSSGAGNRNVLLMIWIFVLAGAFAATAKDIGAIDATVNATLRILPGKLIFAGIFLAACFISMAIGTSVGTIVALVPIAAGIAAETGVGVPLMTAVVIGGAFFGDNLSFISDTTVAATKTQGCSMRDKFRANLWIAAPAALLVTVLYVVMGLKVEAAPAVQSVQWLGLVPYLLVIGLALAGVNVVTVLTIGIIVNGILGWSTGAYDWIGWMTSIGTGIGSMGELIIVSLLAGGMLALIRYNGGLDFIIDGLTRRIRGPRGAYFSIAGLVSLVNFCTANNTIAIIRPRRGLCRRHHGLPLLSLRPGPRGRPLHRLPFPAEIQSLTRRFFADFLPFFATFAKIPREPCPLSMKELPRKALLLTMYSLSRRTPKSFRGK